MYGRRQPHPVVRKNPVNRAILLVVLAGVEIVLAKLSSMIYAPIGRKTVHKSS